MKRTGGFHRFTAGLLCFIMMLTMALTAMPMTAFAEEYTDGYLIFQISEGKAKISGCDNFASGSITIPSTFRSYRVDEISNCAFEFCEEITEIIIPNGVETIGLSAFEHCTNLKTINIPNSVTSIGDSAFKDCSSLESIVIPGSVPCINDCMFQYCINLKSVEIQYGVETIGIAAFESCSALTEITIPDSVTTIGYKAFNSCFYLESISISKNVTIIDEWFYGCTLLESVDIPSNVVSVKHTIFNSIIYMNISGGTMTVETSSPAMITGGSIKVLDSDKELVRETGDRRLIAARLNLPTDLCLNVDGLYDKNGEEISYGTENMKTGDNGILYIWLQENTTLASISAGGRFYDCDNAAGYAVADGNSLSEYTFNARQYDIDINVFFTDGTEPLVPPSAGWNVREAAEGYNIEQYSAPGEYNFYVTPYDDYLTSIEAAASGRYPLFFKLPDGYSIKGIYKDVLPSGELETTGDFTLNGSFGTTPPLYYFYMSQDTVINIFVGQEGKNTVTPTVLENPFGSDFETTFSYRKYNGGHKYSFSIQNPPEALTTYAWNVEGTLPNGLSLMDSDTANAYIGGIPLVLTEEPVNLTVSVYASTDSGKIYSASVDVQIEVIEPPTLHDNSTPEDPNDDYYLIGNANDLYWFAERINLGYAAMNAKLTNDIYLNPGYTFMPDGTYTGGSSPRIWQPMGFITNSYTNRYIGTFDGCGFKVDGIYYNDSSNSMKGLFGAVGEGGIIRNVTVSNSYIQGNNNIGGVCASNYGMISNCYNNGTVKGTAVIGGVVGNNSGIISNCYNAGSVTGSSVGIGGVIGYCYSGTVSGCYNIGRVTGTGNTFGGVCGYRYDSSCAVIDCYYLDTSVSGGNSEGTAKTAAQFADGSVAWLLNTSGKDSDDNEYAHSGVWSQGESYPIFADKTNKAVYKVGINGAVEKAFYLKSGEDFTMPETIHSSEYTEPVAVSADVKITADTAIVSAQPILGSSITMVYKANIKTSLISGNNPQMVFTYREKTYTVSGTAGTSVGEYTPYTFAFTKITPQCMGDSIDVSLTVDGETVTKTGYTLKNYCDTMLAKSETELAELIPATATPAELKALLSDILLYGAASQVYMEYKVDALVGNLDTLEFENFTTTDKAVTGTKNDNAVFTATGLWFENINKIYWKIAVSEENLPKLSVDIYRDGAAEPCGTALTKVSDGIYIAYSEGITVNSFGTKYNAVITYEGVKAQTATYSVNSYVYSMQGKATAIGTLVKALGNYGNSATAYTAE